MGEVIVNDWDEIISHAPWGDRRGLRCVSDGNYIYLCGGQSNDGSICYNDVWRSEYGREWERIVENAPWGGRYWHGFSYYNEKFYVVGGRNNTTGELNDCWSSEDLISWTQETNAAFPSGRSSFALCIHNDYMFTTGGRNGATYYRSVYRSNDGITWTFLGNITGNWWEYVAYHVSLSFQGKIWIWAGIQAYDLVIPEYLWMLSSVDGAVWVDNGDDRVVLVGGRYNWFEGDRGLNTVLRSSNGTVWNTVVQINAPPPRCDFAMLSHRGRAYLIGGYTSGTPINSWNDVWSTEFELFADFTGTPRILTLGHDVAFNNISSGDITGYSWDFGDGESSTEENPVHRYGAPGVYTVTLTVSDGTDTHTTTRTDYITVTLDFIGVPRSGVKPLEVAFKL
jgi:hypothetical protein